MAQQRTAMGQWIRKGPLEMEKARVTAKREKARVTAKRGPSATLRASAALVAAACAKRQHTNAAFFLRRPPAAPRAEQA